MWTRGTRGARGAREARKDREGVEREGRDPLVVGVPKVSSSTSFITRWVFYL